MHTTLQPARSRDWNHPGHASVPYHLRQAIAELERLRDDHADRCTDPLCGCDSYDAMIFHLELYAGSVAGDVLPVEEADEPPDVPAGVRVADGIPGNPFYPTGGR